MTIDRLHSKEVAVNVTKYFKPWTTLVAGIILGVVVYPRVRSKIG